MTCATTSPLSTCTFVHLVRQVRSTTRRGCSTAGSRAPDSPISAEVVDAHIAPNDVTSPLQRAQETAAPNAVMHDLEIVDVESEIYLEGLAFDRGKSSLTKPPRPSLGEPSEAIAPLILEEARRAVLASLLFEEDELLSITYSEPAAELLAGAAKGAGA